MLQYEKFFKLRVRTGKSKPKTQKQSEENIISSIRNFFILQKENKAIKNRTIRYIRTLFELEDDDFYKPKRVSNFWNNTIKYEGNGDRNKNLSMDKYLDKIRSYLRDIIIVLQEFDKRKIQLAIGINFISSKDGGEKKKCAMHPKSNNTKFTSYNNGNILIHLF